MFSALSAIIGATIASVVYALVTRDVVWTFILWFCFCCGILVGAWVTMKSAL